MRRPTTIRVSVVQSLRTRPSVEGPVEVRDIKLSPEDVQWILDAQQRAHHNLPYERVDTYIVLVCEEVPNSPPTVK